MCVGSPAAHLLATNDRAELCPLKSGDFAAYKIVYSHVFATPALLHFALSEERISAQRLLQACRRLGSFNCGQTVGIVPPSMT
jgi:hypothetical protein